MPVYSPPVEDMRFVLHELVQIEHVVELPGYEEASREVVDAVLEEAAKFCRERLLPLNASGDEEGCRYDDGTVRTPTGFKEAYRSFADGGWTGLACDAAYGGQGLPGVVAVMVDEMLCASNLSFSTYVGLSHGAYNAITQHASEELKQRYLPDIVAGRFSGTMCLTEPQCGTDLGLIRTTAVPHDDGTFRVTGTKIFISAGEHDLTENIIHLVLARTPDAPPGIKGLSLFLVPKLALEPDERVGESNQVACSGIEHKMGIRASSTCTMNFDGATAHLIGGLHHGMRAMFTMMNAARLAVGIQGLGIAEAAYQGAVAYARERRQGRSLRGARHPDQPADPIIVHPDVRRMLLTLRAYSEGARALGAWVAKEGDIAARHPDPDVRAEAEEFIGLMTPVVKAFFTDLGFEAANLGIQVYGGHGYIRANGMEQYARDARITQIYEGTNGIQALDLVGRKLPADMGRHLRRFFHPVQRYIEQHRADPALTDLIEPLAKGFARLQDTTGWIAREAGRDPEQAAAGATEYLRLFGLVAMAYVWVRAAEISLRRLGGEDDGLATQGAAFYQAKVDTGRFFLERLLPQTSSLRLAIKAGATPVMKFDEESF